MKYVLVIFLFIYGISIAQTKDNNTYTISFEKKIIDNYAPQGVSRSIVIPQKVSDYSSFKNIPKNNDLFEIYFITIDTEQEFYNNYKKNKISESQYLKYISENDIDTTLFYDNQSVNNYIHLYIGLDLEKEEKKVIVDSNYNLDFSDDSLFVFKLDDYKYSRFSKERTSLCPIIELKNPFYRGRIDESPNISILLNPFNADKNKSEYSNENEFYLNMEIHTNHYKIGELNLGRKKVKILGRDMGVNLINKNINKKSDYRFLEKDKPVSIVYALGDTVQVADKKILLNKIGNHSLLLEEIESLTDSSQIGNFLPDLYSMNITTNESLHLNKLTKDKYVFIDFWGSWCKPCIASIPKIKELFNKVEKIDEAMILGIVLEKENDIPTLQNIIRTKEIKWLNVWNNSSTRKSLHYPHGKLKIESFPTYLIIDKNGKIVYRATSEKELDAAIGFFLYLIQQKI